MAPATTKMNDTQVEAERLGRVAFHQGSSIEACPYVDSDMLRDFWRSGWGSANKGKDRLDMSSPEMARGYRAFQDGVREDECRPPYKRDAARNNSWRDGWKKASDNQKKNDDRIWR